MAASFLLSFLTQLQFTISVNSFPGTYLARGARNFSVKGGRSYTTVQIMMPCRRAMLPDNHDGSEVGFQADAGLCGKATMSDRKKHFVKADAKYIVDTAGTNFDQSVQSSL